MAQIQSHIPIYISIYNSTISWISNKKLGKCLEFTTAYHTFAAQIHLLGRDVLASVSLK
jgi:hypothetical protein